MQKNYKTWNDLLCAVLVDFAPKQRGDSFICGDKTPGYLKHMVLLKRIFPRGKFVHIIRDTRDDALSVRKAYWSRVSRSRATWPRRVTPWARRIMRSRADASSAMRFFSCGVPSCPRIEPCGGYVGVVAFASSASGKDS